MSLQGSGTRPQDTGTTAAPEDNGAAQLPADLQDERLIARQGISGAVGAFTSRLRSGDLGSVPVVVGLVIIWAVFQIANSSFLSSRNLVNLTLQTTSVGVIALGIVLVLLLGEIDLSVGSVSGVAAAVVGVTFVNQGWPIVLSLVAAIALGVLIGLFYGLLYTRFGVPSFVITLAGLLGFLGLQLWLLGSRGAVNLPFDSGLVRFAQLDFVPAWLSYVLAAVAATALFLTGYSLARARRAAGLSGRSTSLLLARSVAVLLGLGFAVWYLNQARGVGWLFVGFVVLVLVLHYVLTRTAWGRSVFAIGGNVEAARRAGINVKRMYISVFMLCSSLAALGGLIAAARLAAANQASGAGDVNLNAIAAAVIGGTSLFGGRGSAFSALLGVLVIQSISSGLTLLDLDSSFRFMVTGLVLALAVALDSVARRSRAAHGRA